MKANKGEWSEFYVFLKILSEKKLPAADCFLQIINDKFFIFHSIIKREKNNLTKIYDISGDEILILDENGGLLKTYKDSTLSTKLINIFQNIKENSNTTFEIPEVEELMKSLLCSNIKASSTSKADIEGVIEDRVSNDKNILGFSIKSMVGSASTLLNAGKTTNFIYKINNLDKSLIENINNISTKAKIQDRLKTIFQNGGTLEFQNLSNQTFATNLRMIDTILPQIVSEMLLLFFQGKCSKTPDLVKSLEDNQNLESFRLNKNAYEQKIKHLLVGSALGMVPSKEWDGFTRAHGGYIVVRNDGVVLCYHLYNRDEFLKYLYENTKFESASSTRHDYGKVYEEGGNLFIKLNLQIRFLN